MAFLKNFDQETLEGVVGISGHSHPPERERFGLSRATKYSFFSSAADFFLIAERSLPTVIGFL